MKIPTIFGLLLLLLIVSLLVIFTIFLQQISKPIFSNSITNIQISNITDSQATITWFSNSPITTQLQFSSDKNFFTNSSELTHDDRDGNNSIKRMTHIVTIKNLEESKEYYLKILDDEKKEANATPNFKTQTSSQKTSNTETLVGSVVDNSLNPVTDALVFSGQNSSTVSDQGNFLLPVVTTEANNLAITITNGQLKSEVKIPNSLYETPLPAIILGRDLDLTLFAATPSAKVLPTVTITASASAESKKVKYDFNDDGKINVIDLAMLQSNLSKKSDDSKWESIKMMDLNSDGVIDTKDLTLLKSALN